MHLACKVGGMIPFSRGLCMIMVCGGEGCEFEAGQLGHDA